MATPRFVCHRCRHKWKVGKTSPKECPKCGHGNVGHTDPAPSYLGKIVVVLVVALAGAWYFDLLPGSASDAIDEGLDAVEDKIQETRRDVESLDDERPQRRPAKPKAERPAKPKAKAPTKAKPARPAGKTEAPSKPDVVVHSKSSAALSTSYMVKGKIKNKGGADATGVKVVVTFKGASGVVATVNARCPTELAAGKTAKYEAAVAGDDAEGIEDFEVSAVFD